MRTTVTLDDEVAAAVESLRREREIGVSAAVNELVRRGLIAGEPEPAPFVQESSPIGIRIDITNVAEALDELDRLEADQAAVDR